jgi:hypothetical protein
VDLQGLGGLLNRHKARVGRGQRADTSYVRIRAATGRGIGGGLVTQARPSGRVKWSGVVLSVDKLWTVALNSQPGAIGARLGVA